MDNKQTIPLREMISIMGAFERGQKVESKCIVTNYEVDWELDEDPKWNWQSFSYRLAETKQSLTHQFPLPPKGEEWHNPSNLTPDQFELNMVNGWRPLLKSELTPDHFKCMYPERWGKFGWYSGNNICNPLATFRTLFPLPANNKNQSTDEVDANLNK